MSNVFNHLIDDLKFPESYIVATENSDRYLTAVHKSWLRSLLSMNVLPDFIPHDSLSPCEIQAKLKLNESIGSNWCRLLISIVEKSDKSVIALPKTRSQIQSNKEPSYFQILQYISLTNEKTCRKESMRKFDHRYLPPDYVFGKSSAVNLNHHDDVVREIINRIYGCPIIKIHGSIPCSTYSSVAHRKHPNILPAAAVLEANSFFYILQVQEFGICYTIQSCLNFSSAIFGRCFHKSLFVIYQLLRVMSDMHNKSVVLGDITLLDILVFEDLWIQVIPRICDNIYDPQKSKRFEQIPRDYELVSSGDDSISFCESGMQANEKLDISYYCNRWVLGEISNFDYLKIVNKLSGRQYGVPQCHYVFPWVSDFSSRDGTNWRDLSKSKFRLNKGDKQLDLTFDVTSDSIGHVPHHVSDILSEITYYVYRARITPRNILCKYVRPQWVPAEYPPSLQRLQQWTPDECIPEFFSDASIFKSIHPDLPDLELPSWANSVEDFIDCHRTALESAIVSSRLHQWIDLTFGYKLSGSAAVKAKNVCLQLVDKHTSMTNSGIMQLFEHPHPQKLILSPYFSPLFARVNSQNRAKVEDGKVPQQDSNELAVSDGKIINIFHTNSGNLLNINSRNSDGQDTCLTHRVDPLKALISYETTYSFIAKSYSKACVNLQTAHQLTKQNPSLHYKSIVANRRSQEIKVLGCLLAEIFMPMQLRPIGCNLQVSSFSRRVENCRSLLSVKQDEIPKCICYVLPLLLQIEKVNGMQSSAESNTHKVTNIGLPYPSAHQLLLPDLSSHLFFLHPSYPILYSSMKTLYELSSLAEELEAARIDLIQQRSSLAKTIFALSERIDNIKISELYKCIRSLENNQKGTILANFEWMDFILPSALELLQDRKTAIKAAWKLLESITRILGIENSVRIFLKSTLKLYESESLHTLEKTPQLHDSCDNDERMKLFHRSFLLRLIIGFGLKTFLENILELIIQAGYAGIYGEQLVILQFLPYISDAIMACGVNKMTLGLQGAFIGNVIFLRYVITFLSTATLEKMIQDSLFETVICPTINILGSDKISFPDGPDARTFAAMRLIDCLYSAGMKLGHLISKSLQEFFITFDKVLVVNGNLSERAVDVKGDSTNNDEQTGKMFTDELCMVFTPKLAYEAYSLFTQYFGESFMKQSLLNLNSIQELCDIYERTHHILANSRIGSADGIDVSHVTVSGNQIHYRCPISKGTVNESREVLDESRHLKGNWSTYVENELARLGLDNKFSFQQIKLQTFAGHSNAVKCIQVLDNENSFMSGSRDKTVKLWSLRSQGDGGTISQCRFTYNCHQKSVIAMGYCVRTRLAASCDSAVHLWDPFVGQTVSLVKNSYAINTLVPLASPNSTIVAADTRASLNILDTRTSSYVLELKACTVANGLIRCLAVPQSSNWVAVGHSSGSLIVLDLRTGNIISSWKGHEGEILQITAYNENSLLTSSLEQTLSVWNLTDGKLVNHLIGPTEPVHCLSRFDDVIVSGTTANKIGVHSIMEEDFSFSSTKLHSDLVKGVLTTVSVLPLNRLLLLGADTGSITLSY